MYFSKVFKNIREKYFFFVYFYIEHIYRLFKGSTCILCALFNIPYILRYLKLSYKIVRLHWAGCVSLGPSGPEETHCNWASIVQ